MLLDNIHVINMNSSTNRLQMIKSNLDAHGVEFKRFSAIEGKKISDADMNANTTFLCRTLFCSKAMVGCGLSHITLWKKLLLDKTTDNYLIMEDDCIINNDFVKYVSKMENVMVEKNIDILSFHCFNSLNCAMYNQIEIIDNKYKIGNSIYPLSFTCYAISKIGAMKLLSNFKKINYHIDFEVAFMTIFHDLNYCTVCPNLVKTNMKINSTLGYADNNLMFIKILKLFNLHELSWMLTEPILVLFMKFPINAYFVLLIILFIVSVLIKNYYVLFFVLLELFLYVIYLF